MDLLIVSMCICTLRQNRGHAVVWLSAQERIMAIVAKS